MRCIVNETLAGRGERLKGYSLALAVFDRPDTFDSNVDPIVRVEAARYGINFANIMRARGKTILFASICPRVRTRHKSSREMRVSRESVSKGNKYPRLFPFDDLNAGQNLDWVRGYPKTS